MYFRKIVGKKCYLSPMDANDAEKFTEWFNDLELMVNLQLYNCVINVEGERAFLSNPSNDHNYSIIDIEKNEVIGNCGFMEIDNLNGTAEIGIFIGNKDYRNKGYGTEALTLLLDYGFKALNLHNILLRVYSFNKPAIRSYEKIGFKNIGKRREALQRNMERHDIVYMDLLVNEFYEKNKI
ncbi:GNAT family N-acetyltransferase [Treponema sp. R80B11-R83G3]